MGENVVGTPDFPVIAGWVLLKIECNIQRIDLLPDDFCHRLILI